MCCKSFGLILSYFLALFISCQSLPEYVSNQCYGNSFNFDCGRGHKIKITRDFYGYSEDNSCEPSPDDCVVPNPNTDSLIHRYCTGKSTCPYFQVERRACNGLYTNYQQVEYQCVPDKQVINMCRTMNYNGHEIYISSPNFPQNYPPGLDCSCFITTDTNAVILLEIIHMSIKHNFPCGDWLRIGRSRMCGMVVDLFSGQQMPLEFHSDNEGGHAGFWLHLKSSKPDGKLYVQCGNKTLQSLLATRGYVRPGRTRNPTSQNPRTRVQPTQQEQSNNARDQQVPRQRQSNPRQRPQQHQGTRSRNQQSTRRQQQYPRQQPYNTRRRQPFQQREQIVNSRHPVTNSQQEANPQNHRLVPRQGQVTDRQPNERVRQGMRDDSSNVRRPELHRVGTIKPQQSQQAPIEQAHSIRSHNATGSQSSSNRLQQQSFRHEGVDHRDRQQPSRYLENKVTTDSNIDIEEPVPRGNVTHGDQEQKHFNEQNIPQTTKGEETHSNFQSTQLVDSKNSTETGRQGTNEESSAFNKDKNEQMTSNIVPPTNDFSKAPSQHKFTHPVRKENKHFDTPTPEDELQRPVEGEIFQTEGSNKHDPLKTKLKELSKNGQEQFDSNMQVTTPVVFDIAKFWKSKNEETDNERPRINPINPVDNKDIFDMFKIPTENIDSNVNVKTEPTVLWHHIFNNTNRYTEKSFDDGEYNENIQTEEVSHFNSGDDNKSKIPVDSSKTDMSSVLPIDQKEQDLNLDKNEEDLPFNKQDSGVQSGKINKDLSPKKNQFNEDGENNENIDIEKDKDEYDGLLDFNIDSSKDENAGPNIGPFSLYDNSDMYESNIQVENNTKHTDLESKIYDVTNEPIAILGTNELITTESSNSRMNSDSNKNTLSDIKTEYTSYNNVENPDVQLEKGIQDGDIIDERKGSKNQYQNHDASIISPTNRDFSGNKETPLISNEKRFINNNTDIRTEDFNIEKMKEITDKSIGILHEEVNNDEQSTGSSDLYNSGKSYLNFEQYREDNVNDYGDMDVALDKDYYDSDKSSDSVEDKLEPFHTRDYNTGGSNNNDDKRFEPFNTRDFNDDESNDNNREKLEPFNTRDYNTGGSNSNNDEKEFVPFKTNYKDFSTDENNEEWAEAVQNGDFNADEPINNDEQKVGPFNTNGFNPDESIDKTEENFEPVNSVDFNTEPDHYIDMFNIPQTYIDYSSVEEPSVDYDYNMDNESLSEVEQTVLEEISDYYDNSRLPEENANNDYNIQDNKDSADFDSHNSDQESTNFKRKQDTFEDDGGTELEIDKEIDTIHGNHYFGDIIDDVPDGLNSVGDVETRAERNVTGNRTSDDFNRESIYDSDQDDSTLTLGLIIISVCVAAGLILLTCFFVAVLIQRRKRRASVAPSRPTLAILHAKREMAIKQQHDGDSGKSLLIHAEQNHNSTSAESYAKGRGHQSVVDVDSLYTKPKRKDKMIQADMSDGYEEVAITKKPVVFNIESTDSDASSSLSNFAPVLSPYNGGYTGTSHDHKAIQAKTNLFQAATSPIMYASAVNNNPGQGINVNSPKLKVHSSKNKNKIKEQGLKKKHGKPQSVLNNNNYNNNGEKPSIPPKPAFLRGGDTQQCADENPNNCSKDVNVHDSLKKKTIASMPGLAEMTFMPENSPVYYEITEPLSDEDDTDWETKSAISL